MINNCCLYIIILIIIALIVILTLVLRKKESFLKGENKTISSIYILSDFLLHDCGNVYWNFSKTNACKDLKNEILKTFNSKLEEIKKTRDSLNVQTDKNFKWIISYNSSLSGTQIKELENILKEKKYTSLRKKTKFILSSNITEAKNSFRKGLIKDKNFIVFYLNGGLTLPNNKFISELYQQKESLYHFNTKKKKNKYF